MLRKLSVYTEYELAWKYLAASDEDNRKQWLEVFKRRSEKQKLVFDPDVVGLDLQRYQQMKKKNQGIKKNPLEYKSITELHEAMSGYKTKQEMSLEFNNDVETGKQLLWEDGKYTVFEATTPQALSTLAKGSRWCVQNVQTAAQYLNDLGKFFIVLKEGLPLFALVQDQIWYKTDFDLRGGTSYATYPPQVLKEDYVWLNNFLLPNLREEPLNTDNFEVVTGESNILDLIQKYEDKEDAGGVCLDDPETIAVFQVLHNHIGRFTPGIEARIEDFPEFAFVYATETLSGHAVPKNIVSSIAQNSDLALKYAKEIIKGPFPEAEKWIARVPRLAVEYAKKCLKGPFPLAEPEIARDAYWACDYASGLEKPFPLGEKAIAREGRLSIRYARFALKGRFLAGEKVISESAEDSWNYIGDIRLHTDIPEKIREAILFKGSTHFIWAFARDYEHKRIPEAEDRLFAGNREWAEKYLRYIEQQEGGTGLANVLKDNHKKHSKITEYFAWVLHNPNENNSLTKLCVLWECDKKFVKPEQKR